MSDNELLLVGFELMLLGMGIVFAFLILLIFTTRLMSLLVTRFLPAPAPVVKAAPKMRSATAKAPEQDAELLAVIQSAVSQHRARRG
ncbi:OadG family protein [Atopomonas sediminilitoris]|uniref:OadG family protein n=1 Tax=Atopomonas sediminilitoris TaxID=2919919 RepID=UPI001F4EE82A|nr:OadG family protein [Atopomonas sediminilitoris]MCJ8170050.1 OadG family protein [Atopomonas sediminilitoris]